MERPETVALTYDKFVVKGIEDGWYMAQSEHIQGALTQGRTVEEAKENLKDAIYLLLEDEMEDYRKK